MTAGPVGGAGAPVGGNVYGTPLHHVVYHNTQAVGVETDDSQPADRRELAIRDFCDELAELLVQKQRAYGPDAITRAPGGPVNGLRVRIFDKHARFQNLSGIYEGDVIDPGDEPLQDTLMDLAGYGVIGALVTRGTW